MNGTVWRRFLVGASMLLATAALAADPPEKRPAPRELTKDEIAVNKAIDRGVAYLKKEWAAGPREYGIKGSGQFTGGQESLVGWALLESGVPKDDPSIKKTAALIRDVAPKIDRTYALSLAILFLDKLGNADDDKLIRSFALRLVNGRLPGRGKTAKPEWGWSYVCPVLKPQVEQQQLKLLKPGDADPKLPAAAVAGYVGPRGMILSDQTPDNSNTQFAVLALWVAQRHDLNLRPVLAGAIERFRRRQKPDGGFDYAEDFSQATASMTCAGLMALAMSHDMGKPARIAKDPAVEKGFRFLAQRIGQPPVKFVAPQGFGGGAAGGGVGDFIEQSAGQVGPINCYTAWSLERTAMIYDLKTIGDKDWYAWASKAIVAAQQGDGSFKTIRGDTGGPLGCTSFSLLVLKRAHPAPDLTTAVKQRLDLSAVGELNDTQSMLKPESMLPMKDDKQPRKE